MDFNNVEPYLPTDGLVNELIDVVYNGVKSVKDVPGLTCEIGLRLGGGSKYIIDALVDTQQQKTHIALDPYGNIDYASSDKNLVKLGYNNEMRDQCLANMYFYCLKKQVNFHFFCLEDIEFFKRFSDGVPIYQEQKQVINQYSFVYFDGPHSRLALQTEIAFFQSRTPQGAVFVFDDVHNYDHNQVEAFLLHNGWEALRHSSNKCSYRKVSLT